MQYKQLYQEMLLEINSAQSHNLLSMAENCFWIACKYWELLKKMIDKKIFDTASEEINFFKTVKPLFTCQIQYYTMLCEVLMFVPPDDDIQVVFWKEEKKRFDRFYVKNRVFIAYYTSSSVEFDSHYFVRVKPGWEPVQRPPSYDSDRKFCSTHDHLIRVYLANKMYYEYVCERLKMVEC